MTQKAKDESQKDNKETQGQIVSSIHYSVSELSQGGKKTTWRKVFETINEGAAKAVYDTLTPGKRRLEKIDTLQN